MKNYTVGTVKCNKQAASAYIAYMMVGSYFLNAKMESSMLEKRLLMNYKLLSAREQVEREEEMERLIRQKAADCLNKLSTLKCVVHVKSVMNEKGKQSICLWFETGFEEILVTVEENGTFRLHKKIA